MFLVGSTMEFKWSNESSYVEMPSTPDTGQYSAPILISRLIMSVVYL